MEQEILLQLQATHELVDGIHSMLMFFVAILAVVGLVIGVIRGVQ